MTAESTECAAGGTVSSPPPAASPSRPAHTTPRSGTEKVGIRRRLSGKSRPDRLPIQTDVARPRRIPEPPQYLFVCRRPMRCPRDDAQEKVRLRHHGDLAVPAQHDRQQRRSRPLTAHHEQRGGRHSGALASSRRGSLRPVVRITPCFMVILAQSLADPIFRLLE